MADFSGSRPDGRSLVVLLSLALGITSVCFQYVFIVSPSLRTLLALGPEAFGWLLSSWLILGLAGNLLGGWLADRGHLRVTMYASIAVLALSYGVCAMPPSYTRFMAGLAIMGLCNATLSTLGNVVITRAYPLGARKPLTWLMLAYAATGVLGPPAWAYLLAWLSGTTLGLSGAVQLLFAVAGTGCLLALVVLNGKSLPEAPPELLEDGSLPRRGLRQIVGWPLVMVCLFAALHSAADNSMFLWLPDFASRRYDPSPFPVAWILSAYSAAYVVGRLVLLRLPDRLRDLTLLGIAAGSGSVLYVLAFQSDTQHVLGVFYVIGGLLISADYPAIMSYIGQAFPRSTGRVMAIVGAASSAASVLLPPFMGFVGQATGSMVAGMMVPPVLLLVLSATAFGWRARGDRPTPGA